MPTTEKQPRSLLNRPDVATEVGFLIMFAANLEAWLIPILAELLHDDDDAAVAIVCNVDNISAKLGIVFEIADRRPNDPRATAIREHRPAIEKAIAHRNALAHSQYGWTDDDQVALIRAVVTNRRGDAKGELFDLKATRVHTENLRAAVRAILGERGERMEILTDGPQPPASSGKRAPAIRRLERLRPGHKD